MRFLFSLIIIAICVSCRRNAVPDVSSINITLSTQRFERDLFALDTTQMINQLDKLMLKYPGFGETYLKTIINVDPLWNADTTANYLRSFINSYRNVFDSSERVFADFSPFETSIKNGLKYVHYYFPGYRVPTKIITYIGPLDGYGDILDEGVFYIGLHQHLGKKFSLYKTVWVQETYPDYISNRFEPSYIDINALHNIVLDMYPEQNEDKTLIMQMIEKGKRLYLLSRFLPYTPEYKLIGYSEEQLKESYAHETAIWNLFIQNNFLQTIDNNIIKNYIGEGPKTQELGDASPGNIGSFTGWQIIKKYMDKYPKTSLSELMQSEPEKIFQEAKYKP